MKRREFIALLGGAAATWPLAARAQQEPGVPLVGLLRNTPSASFEHIVAALRRGLSEAGFVDARNVAIEQRWAEGDDDKLPALLADLVGRRVAVIVANTAGALAAKAAATTVPVVFATGSDPVRDGLVASLNRPGANFTGVTFISSDLGTKRLELLRQLVSRTTTMGMLIGPDVPETIAERADVQKAAQALGQQVVVAQATSLGEIAAAFTAFVERGAGSLFVGTGAFTNSHREAIVALAAHRALPAIYSLREFASIGGLISYGTSITDAYHQAGIYVGRILKGERPADLPVMQSTKFELVLNLRTAKALGITIPPTLLAIADEVIE